MKTGKGGYGGITTMNTDQREGRYGEHLTISRFVRADGLIEAKCLDCGEEWLHDKHEKPDVGSCLKKTGQ